MTPIEIDNKLVSYRIFPRYDKVYAEIYYKAKYQTYDTEHLLIFKEFGGMWRKPNDSDYTKALLWCKNQIKNIKEVNE